MASEFLAPLPPAPLYPPRPLQMKVTGLLKDPRPSSATVHETSGLQGGFALDGNSSREYVASD